MVDLYKVSMNRWVVVKSNQRHEFGSPEDMATALESIGVTSDEIDFALIDMATKGNCRAQFGTNLTFVFSDRTSLN